MFTETARKSLNGAQVRASEFFRDRRLKPSVLDTDNLPVFFRELRRAVRLITEEKEIIAFAILQWIVIAVAYVIWTAILDWIPESVWNEVAAKERNGGEGTDFILVNLVLLGWSFVIVAAASYPLSVLSSAMIHAHYLRASGQRSTLSACIHLAFRNLGRMWIFTTIDAWITVTAILDRLPGRRYSRTFAEELLYNAWKIGTIGVLPALAAGRTHLEAAKESILLLTTAPYRAIGIRMGYSLACWIVGLLAYGGTIWYLSHYGGPSTGPNWIYNFYVLMAIPLTIAVGVVTVLVRPFFLIMVSKLYTDVVPLPALTATPEDSGTTSVLELLVLFLFVFLFVFLLMMFLLGDDLGMSAWIESLAMQDMLRHTNDIAQ